MSSLFAPEVLEALKANGILKPKTAQQAKLRQIDAEMGNQAGRGFAALFMEPEGKDVVREGRQRRRKERRAKRHAGRQPRRSEAIPERDPFAQELHDLFASGAVTTPGVLPPRRSIIMRPEDLGLAETNVQFSVLPDEWLQALIRERPEMVKHLPPGVIERTESRILSGPAYEKEMEKHRQHQWKEQQLGIQRPKDF